MGIKTRAIMLVPSIVFAILMAFFALGYLITIVFGIPYNLGLPLPVRSVGILVLALGFIFLSWLFRYRKPLDILVSTYITFLKVGRRTPLEDWSGRTEPLVVKGPYRHVRHPLYFAVVLLILGWSLVLDYSFLLFSTFLLLLWFNFVVARFEEKELRAIFREQYEQYAKEVASIIPFTNLGKKWYRKRAYMKLKIQ